MEITCCARVHTTKAMQKLNNVKTLRDTNTLAYHVTRWAKPLSLIQNKPEAMPKVSDI